MADDLAQFQAQLDGLLATARERLISHTRDHAYRREKQIQGLMAFIDWMVDVDRQIEQSIGHFQMPEEAPAPLQPTAPPPPPDDYQVPPPPPAQPYHGMRPPPTDEQTADRIAFIKSLTTRQGDG